MDFYLPKGNIALFVDGSVWHADPRIYRAGDLLFFGKTAKQIWKKDLHQTNYLESQGYAVLRFWEREIYEGIDNCLKIIIDSIQFQRVLVCRIVRLHNWNLAKGREYLGSLNAERSNYKIHQNLLLPYSVTFDFLP